MVCKGISIKLKRTHQYEITFPKGAHIWTSGPQ